jgi:hypothetical protein
VGCALSNILSPIANTYCGCARRSKLEFLSREEVYVHHNYHLILSRLFLTASLAAPSAMNAASKPQDNGRQEEHRDHNHNRMYDRDHRDYHNWNDNEDRSYRVYLGERHREYHPFVELRVKEQRAYWNWRHRHPGHDHDRDGR